MSDWMKLLKDMAELERRIVRLEAYVEAAKKQSHAEAVYLEADQSLPADSTPEDGDL